MAEVADLNALLVYDYRDATPEGHLIATSVWRVPEVVPAGAHGFRYRLAYVVDGERVVGFDNTLGTGDQCYLNGETRPYVFTDLDCLFEDFIAEVDKRRAP